MSKWGVEVGGLILGSSAKLWAEVMSQEVAWQPIPRHDDRRTACEFGEI